MADLVRLDARAIATFLRSPGGPVLADQIRKGDRVQQLAKQQVGYDAKKPPGEEGGEHLRDTIVKRVVQGSRGPEVWVGSEHPRARLHHDGTEPHDIVPVRAKVLRFTTTGGVTIFARRVSHPGTDPNPYLTGPLERVFREG